MAMATAMAMATTNNNNNQQPTTGQRATAYRLLPGYGKGGARRKTSKRTASFGPTDVVVGIIWPRTRQKRSLAANGFG
jgi:hypothetical protein